MRCYRELHPQHASDGPSSRQHSLDHSQEPAISTNAGSAPAAATTQPAVKRHRSKSLDSRAIASIAVQDSQREGFGSQEDLARHK